MIRRPPPCGLALGLLASAAPALAQTAAPATLNTGDTAWLLTSTLLVILMSIPGLALFYGGLARAKNMLSVLTQVFVIYALISVLWAIYGYTLAFGGTGLVLGGWDHVFLQGITPSSLSSVMTTVPHYVFVAFQSTFAAIAPSPTWCGAAAAG